MNLDDADRYAALRARDARFDGVFFVGVRTTGIYCRPICPARLPRRDNCTFFRTAAEAERDGFRACLRCRPELAPGLASVDARSRLAQQAAYRIREGYLNDHLVSDLADHLDVSSRHLRRVLRAELGVGPTELAQTRRLAVAKQLLHDTTIPVSRVAFAAGFSSIRRFNAAFAERFSRPPSAIRRGGSRSTARRRGPDSSRTEEKGSGLPGANGTDEAIVVRLDYRPPLAWGLLLRFLEKRATPGVEAVRGEAYLRFVQADDGGRGRVEVTSVPDRPSLKVSIPIGLAVELPTIVAGLRRLFDLDARPDVIADHLKGDVDLGPGVARHPGLRVPGAYDSFELAVRTILGQQITVEAATSLCGRFVDAFGDGASGSSGNGSVPTESGRRFPSPARVSTLSPDDVSQLGMPRTRGRAIVELARAIRDDGLSLDPTSDPRDAAPRLRAIPGVGPWTVQYILMRAVRWPNAFPASDLGLRRALGGITAAEAEDRSRAWEPWRAYAAIHLWNRPSTGETDDERSRD